MCLADISIGIEVIFFSIVCEFVALIIYHLHRILTTLALSSPRLRCTLQDMKILITYGTNSSGAQAVSGIVADCLLKSGHRVTVKRAHESGAGDFKKYDLVVLGSCTWERFEGKERLEGQLQQHMYALTEQLHGKSFGKQQFAIFGLGDSSYTDFCAAADKLEKFVHDVGGKLRVPTLRIDGFFFDLEKNRQKAQGWAEGLVVSIGT